MVEILIVGAGPVGLNLSLCLNHLKIKHRIIDKKPGPNVTSNAIGVNPRTLEIWQTLGFVEQALERGVKLTYASWYDEGKKLNKADFSLLESKFNFMLALPQAQTECLLNEQVTKFGSKVEWNTELVAYTDKDGKITAICNQNGNEEIIEASWIIGCDGYRSSVRELAQIERVCHDLTQHFIMVDAKLNGYVATNELSVSFHDDGVLFFFPMKNSMRVVAEISHDPVHKNAHVGTDKDKAIFDDILNKRFPGVSIKEIEWVSSFYVHECLANSYYKNHTILCGDAAHTHSPAGGQGMNTGIQDGWNLSWKLAHIIQKQASEKLLESYHAERHQIAEEVLNRSGKMTSISTTSNKILQAIRNFGISHIVSLDKIASKFVNSIGQTDIYYKQSKLVNNKNVSPNETKRCQLDKFEWLLLCKNTLETAQSLPNFIHIEQSNNQLVSKWKFCLIRPDGYIATYDNTIENIQSFLTLNGFEVKPGK